MGARAARGAGGDWATRLSRVESRNVTHLGRPTPFWTHATGAEVTDTGGRRYLDLTGAFGVAFAGHRHPLVRERIADQAQRLIHGMGDVHPPAVKVEFLERLAERLPWADPRTILGLSGSDAVEAALKTAQLATGRAGVVAFEGSYHGLTLGALATTHREHFRRPFTDRLADHVRHVPFPVTEAEAVASLARVREIFAAGCGRDVPGSSPRRQSGAALPVGAVIVEPIQGRGGVRIPPPGFLPALLQLAHGAGAVLIADEIFTGMGRTGSLFGSDHDGMAPDLICVGKALGGGMPLSACSGPRSVMDAWPASTGEAIHTSTFLGHPLSCAAGLGFLDALDRDDLTGRARRLGAWALDYLKTELANDRRVRDVRGRGLMLGVEMARREGGGQASMGNPNGAAGTARRMAREDSGLAGAVAGHQPGAAVAAAALERGAIALPAGPDGSVVELTPPATISRDDLQRGLDAVAAAIRSLPG